MKKIIACIYWVYKSKRNNIPYASTILTVSGFAFIHICQIILLFGIPDKYFFPFKLHDTSFERWLNASLLLTPLIFLFIVFFRKSSLEKFSFSDDQIKKGKRLIPLYFFITFVILIILLIREGVKRGTL